MDLLCLIDMVNPGRRFAVGSEHPATLAKGTIVSLGQGDDPDFSNEDQELLRLSRCVLALPTAKLITRVNEEIEAEKKFWAARQDPNAEGCSTLRGFRIGRKQTKSP